MLTFLQVIWFLVVRTCILAFYGLEGAARGGGKVPSFCGGDVLQLLSIDFMRRNKWFLLVVVLPVLLAALYYALLASPEYVSESRFVIKSPAQRSASVTSIASILQTSSISSGEEQAGEVVDFIRSRSAFAALNQHGQLAAIYSRPGTDFISRYPKLGWSPTMEGMYRYYGKMVNAEIDRETGVVVLKTDGFSAQDAQAINQNLLTLSEQLVNQLNEHARNQQVEEAERRVVIAERRVQKARAALAVFRNAHDILDPTKQATGVLEIASKLVSEQASLEAQLQLTEREAPRNPSIPALKARIAALDTQIAAQNNRAVGSPGAIASNLTGYENLDLEQQFAAQNLVAANASLETARSDALRQQFYLERVVEPDAADVAELPHGFRNVITLAAGLLCIYFVGWMFIAGILEHSPEH